MTRSIVGVLRGGRSDGYASSLRTGASVLQALPEEHYDVRDILIDHNGVWHTRGIPVAPMRALSGVDVVVNALYNDALGESGEVARALKQSGVPYTGTRGTTASLVLNRTWTRKALDDVGILMPRAHAVTARHGEDTASMAQRIFTEFGPPYMVKPVASGAAIGMRIARTVHELPSVLADMFALYETLLVEEYMHGTHVSVGIIENFRNESLYALPPAEFMLPEGFAMPDFDARMHESAAHRCPWHAHHDNKQELMRLARNVHEKLGLAHYSRADFVVKGPQFYLVSVNALPELHEGAAFPAMLDSVGVTQRQFIEHLISAAQGN